MLQCIALCIMLLFAAPSFAQFANVSDTGVTNAAGGVLLSGTECFTPVSNQRVAIPAQYPGGTVTKAPICSPVSNGTMTAIQLVKSNVTSPLNLCYQRTIVDSATGKLVIGAADGYGCVQIFGDTNMNTVQPSLGALVVQTVGSQGPAGAQGIQGIPGPAGTGVTSVTPTFSAESVSGSNSWTYTPASSFWSVSGNTITANGSAASATSNYATSNVTATAGQSYSITTTASAGTCAYMGFGNGSGNNQYGIPPNGTYTVVRTAETTQPLTVYSCPGTQNWNVSISIRAISGGDITYGASMTVHGPVVMDYATTSGTLQIGNYTAGYCFGETSVMKFCGYVLSDQGGMHNIADLSTYLGMGDAGFGDIDIKPHIIGPWNHWNPVQLRWYMDPGAGNNIGSSIGIQFTPYLLSGSLGRYQGLFMQEPQNNASGDGSLWSNGQTLTVSEDMIFIDQQNNCLNQPNTVACYAIHSESRAGSFLGGPLVLYNQPTPRNTTAGGNNLTFCNTYNSACGGLTIDNTTNKVVSLTENGQGIFINGATNVVTITGSSVSIPNLSLTAINVSANNNNYFVSLTNTATNGATYGIISDMYGNLDFNGPNLVNFNVNGFALAKGTFSITNSDNTAALALVNSTTGGGNFSFVSDTTGGLDINGGPGGITVNAASLTSVLVMKNHGGDSKLPVCETGGTLYSGTNSSGTLACP